MEKNIENTEKIEDKNIEIENPITEAVLSFQRDRNDKNFISYLVNQKVAILHRSSTVTPIADIQYLCTVDERDRYALVRIQGLAHNPRLIIRADRTCLFVKNRLGDEKAETKTFKDIYEALESEYDQEYAFVLYRKENKDKAKLQPDITDERLIRVVDIEMKLKDPNGSLKGTTKTRWPRSMALDEIIKEVRKRIKGKGIGDDI